MNAYAHHATTSLIQLILWSQFRLFLFPSLLASYHRTRTPSLFHRIFISSRWPIRFRKSLLTTWHFLFDRTHGFLVFFFCFVSMARSLTFFIFLCACVHWSVAFFWICTNNLIDSETNTLFKFPITSIFFSSRFIFSRVHSRRRVHFKFCET